ncbi:MAG: RMD1 family protein [Gammaproteobacteria bacterium]|nr:RMD1 family protein [Gammaproteobacteria bacterium]
MVNQDKIVFYNDKLIVLSLGHQFQQPNLRDKLLESATSSHYRDAVRIQPDKGEAWIFDYGVIVFWGVDDQERKFVLDTVEPYVKGVAVKYEVENFRFELHSNQNLIRQDTVFLSSGDYLYRLAVSHAMAQSIKLNIFEDDAQSTIMKTRHIPRSLAETGRFILSRKKTAKMRGELFSTKSDIILNYGLLDTPDFFWEYPDLESLYELTARYLDIRSRVSVLSNKLETIHELFEMLDNEQKHKHSSKLEWIIIILIAIEIVYFLINEIIH